MPTRKKRNSDDLSSYYYDWKKRQGEEEQEEDNGGETVTITSTSPLAEEYKNYKKRQEEERKSATSSTSKNTFSPDQTSQNAFASSYEDFLKSYNDYYNYAQGVANGGAVSAESAATAKSIADYANRYRNYLGDDTANEFMKSAGDIYDYTSRVGYQRKYDELSLTDRKAELNALKDQMTQLRKQNKTDSQEYLDLTNEYKYLLDYEDYTNASLGYEISKMSAEDQIAEYDQLSQYHDVYSQYGSHSTVAPLPNGYNDDEAQQRMKLLGQYGDSIAKAYIRNKEREKLGAEAERLDESARQMEITDPYNSADAEAAEQYARAQDAYIAERLDKAEVLRTKGRLYDRTNKAVDDALLSVYNNGGTEKDIAKGAAQFLSGDENNTDFVNTAWNDVTNITSRINRKGAESTIGGSYSIRDDGSVWLGNNKVADNADDYVRYIDPEKLEAAYPQIYKYLKQYDSSIRDVKLLDFVTKDEFEMLAYILSTGDERSAEAFANSLERTLEKRQYDHSNESAVENLKRAEEASPFLGFLGRAGQTGANVVGDVFGGIPAFVSNAVNTISGEEIDPYDKWHSIANAAEIGRNAVSSQLAEKYPNFKILGQNGASFLYNSLLSGAESLVGALSVGKAYTFIMGMNAAQQRAKELYERGASNSDVIVGSLTSGINEALWEYVSLDHFLSTDSPVSLLDGLKKLFAQAGVEGSEELATSISNQIDDALTLGVNSDYNTRIRELQEQGLSYEEARRQATKETVEQTVSEGFAGFISAFAMGGRIAQQGVQNYAKGKTVKSNGNVGDFVNIGLQENPDSQMYKVARDIQQKGIANATPMEVGALVNGLLNNSLYLSAQKREELREYTKKATNKKAVVKELIDNGIKEEKADFVADSVIKTINGEKTNRNESRAVEYNAAAKNYVENTQNEQAKILSEGKEQSLKAGIIEAVSNKPISNNSEAAFDEHVSTPLESANLTENEVTVANRTTATVSEGETTAKVTTSDGSTQTKSVDLTTVKNIKQTKDGAVLTFSDDSAANIDDVSFSSEDEAILWETIANTPGISSEAAKTLISEYSKLGNGVTPGVYARGVSEGYFAGQIDITKKGFAKAEQNSRYLRSISNEARELAERFGRNDAKKSRQTAAQTTLRDERNIKSGQSVEEQHKRAQDLVKKLGLEIVYDDTIKGDGEYVNGKQVVLRHDTADPVAFVLKHELTHFAESSKDYAAFADAVTKSKAFASWLEEQTTQGENTAERRTEYISDIKSLYNRNGVKLSTTEAQREMIANFVGDTLFIENGRGIEGMTRGMNTADRNAVIKFLDKLISWFKKRFGGDAAEIKSLEKMFNKALSTSEGKQSVSEGQESFAGRKAQTADFGTLATAQELEEAGEDNEAIRQQTGWFKGTDGKWRFEINDRNMLADTTGKYSRNPDIRRFNELVSKVYFQGTASEAETSELQTLTKSLEGVNKTPRFIGDVIEHEALFEAYPKLADMRFRIASLEDGDIAAYNPESKTIILNEKLRGNTAKIRAALIHEIQHAIQDIEGFSSGTNSSIAGSFTSYYNSAGEVEARDVANRLDMTDEDRLYTRPNTDVQHSISSRNSAKTEYTVGEIAKLNEAVDDLKGMLRLQATETNGAVIQQTSANRAATEIMQKWGLTEGKGTIARMVSDLFTEVAVSKQNGEMLWSDFEKAAQPIVDYIINDEYFAHYAEYGKDVADEAIADYKRNLLLDVFTALERSKSVTTLSDKYAKQYNELKAKTDKRIAELRKQRDDNVAKVLQQARETKKRESERRKKSELRKGITKKIAEFNSALEGINIPPKSKASVANLLKSINQDVVNFESKMVGYEERLQKAWANGNMKEVGKVNSAIATLNERKLNQDARLDKLNALYNKIGNDQDYQQFHDPVVQAYLDNLIADVGDVAIGEMTVEQLEFLNDTLTALKVTMSNANKAASIDERLEIKGIAQRLMAGLRESKKTADVGWLKSFEAAYENQLMRPGTFFKSLGGYAKGSMWTQIGENINDAQRDMTAMLVTGQSMFNKFLKNTKEFNKLRDTVDLGFKDKNGNPVLVSRGFMLTIRRGLMNSKYAADVIQKGMDIPGVEAYYKGKSSKAKESSVRVHGISEQLYSLNQQLEEAKRKRESLLSEKPSDEGEKSYAQLSKEIKSIENQMKEAQSNGELYAEQLAATIDDKLTDYERDLLDVTEQFFSWTGKEMNKTMFATYGIKRAIEEHYLPINASEFYIAKDADMQAIVRGLASLENEGFTIERTGATTVVKIEDITDIINKHLKNISRFTALMPIIKDFSKVYNYVAPAQAESLRENLVKQRGERADKYLRNLIADLAGKRQGAHNSTIFDMVRNAYAGGVLTLNAKTAMVQTSSKWTAVPEVGGFKNVVKAFLRPGKLRIIPVLGGIDAKTLEMMNKHTPLYQYRRMGYNIPELADIKNMRSKKAQIFRKLKFITGWINTMDLYTTGRLWYAAEYKVKHDIKKGKIDAKVGSEEYYEQVGKVYNAAIENTQPNYTVFQRPEVLRNPDGLVRATTQFQTQRMTNANILGEAYAEYKKYHGDLKADGRNGVTLEDVREKRKRFVWAVSSQISAGISIALFTLGSALLLHKTKPYRDDDDELTLESIGLGLLNNFASSEASNFLGISELYTLINKYAKGEKYYAPDVNAVESLYDSAESVAGLATSLIDAVLGGEDDEGDTAERWSKVLESLENFAYKGGNLTGIPAKNMGDFVKAIKGYIADASQGLPIFESDAERTNKQNVKRLYDAIVSGNYENVKKVKKDFADADAYEKAVRQGLREYDTRIKDAAEAYYYGETEKADELAKQIWQKERKFNKTQVEGAIKAELDKIKRDNAPEEETNDEWRDKDLQAGDPTDTSAFVGTSWLAQDLENGNIDRAVSNAADLVKQEKNPASTISRHYEPLYIKAYKNGDATTQSNILKDIEKFHKAGVWKSSAEDILEGWKEKNGIGENPTTLKNSFKSKDYTKAASIAVAMAKRGKDVAPTVRDYYKETYINNPSKRSEIEEILKDIDKALEREGYNLYKEDIDKVLEGWLKLRRHT